MPSYRNTPQHPVIPLDQHFDQLHIGTPHRTPIPDTPQFGGSPEGQPEDWVMGPWSSSGGSPAASSHIHPSATPYQYSNQGLPGMQFPSFGFDPQQQQGPPPQSQPQASRRMARPSHGRQPSAGAAASHAMPGMGYAMPGGFHPQMQQQGMGAPMNTPAMPGQFGMISPTTPYMGPNAAMGGGIPGYMATPFFPAQTLGAMGGAAGAPWAQGFDDGGHAGIPGLGYGHAGGLMPQSPEETWWGGAFPSRKIKMSRPKDEEIVAFNRWQKGGDYGVVIDTLQYSVSKAKLLVNPLLTPPDEKPPEAASLRWSLLFQTNAISLTTEKHRKSWAGRDEPATFPRLSSLRVCSPHFPWLIEVENPQGVNCGDIIEAVFNCLHQYVSKGEYNGLPPAKMSRTMAAYKWNRSTNRNAPGGRLFPKGILRADMLGSRVNWDGLIVDDEYVEKHLNLPTGATLLLMLGDREPHGNVEPKQIAPA